MNDVNNRIFREFTEFFDFLWVAFVFEYRCWM